MLKSSLRADGVCLSQCFSDEESGLHPESNRNPLNTL